MKKSSWRTNIIFLLDWTSIIKTFLLLLFLTLSILLFLNFGYLKMLWLAQKMDIETNGQIIAKEPKYGMNQSLTGNKKTIEYIKITYQYKVDTIMINDTYNLDYSTFNAARLNQINNSNLPVPIRVKYNKKYPYDSMLWIP